MSAEQSRAAFEKWAFDDPFCMEVERRPDDPELHAWPGSYKSLNTAAAWAAWQAASGDLLEACCATIQYLEKRADDESNALWAKVGSAIKKATGE